MSRFHFISPLLLLLIWHGLASILDSQALPTPWQVIQVLYQEISSGALLFHLSMTLIRLSISFFLAMSLGSMIGIVLGQNRTLDRFFDSWLMIFLNIPALVTIILCYVWFGLTEFSAILAVIVNKLPNVIVSLREGSRALDKDLLEMAKVYRLNRIKTLTHVIWPQLFPFIIAAARTGLALIWKIILVVELLGRSDGMGYQLHLFFQMFNVAAILAYTLAFIAFIQTIELFVLKPMDLKARNWKR